MSSELRRILLEAAIIFILGVVIGLSFNYRLIMDVFEGELVPPGQPVAGSESPELFPEPVDLAGVLELRAAGAILVDARIPELYAEGHLPDALSLPWSEFADRSAGFREKVALDRDIVTYCSGYGCTDSFDLAQALLQLGYHRVLVFEGGLPEWRAADLPVIEGAP